MSPRSAARLNLTSVEHSFKRGFPAGLRGLGFENETDFGELFAVQHGHAVSGAAAGREVLPEGPRVSSRHRGAIDVAATAIHAQALEKELAQKVRPVLQSVGCPTQAIDAAVPKFLRNWPQILEALETSILAHYDDLPPKAQISYYFLHPFGAYFPSPDQKEFVEDYARHVSEPICVGDVVSKIDRGCMIAGTAEERRLEGLRERHAVLRSGRGWSQIT